MKKSTLAFLTTVIAFAPLTAFAQNAQVSIQENRNSASAVGTNNFIRQNANQTNVQEQRNLGTYGIPTPGNVQTSVQSNINEAAAVGNYNVIEQDVTQTSVQGGVDLNQYLPRGYNY